MEMRIHRELRTRIDGLALVFGVRVRRESVCRVRDFWVFSHAQLRAFSVS